jgi:hypothetical protein
VVDADLMPLHVLVIPMNAGSAFQVKPDVACLPCLKLRERDEARNAL